MSVPSTSSNFRTFRQSSPPVDVASDDDDDDDDRVSHDGFHEASSQHANEEEEDETMHAGATRGHKHDNDNGNESQSDGEDDWFDASELADLIEQASKHKAAGNAHFTAQRTQDAMNEYRQGVASLPVRKPPKVPATKESAKGKGRQDLGEMFDEHDDDEAPSDKPQTRSKDKIRELVDEKEEKEFVEGAGRSKEEEELIELRSALWGNIAACQLRLSMFREAVDSATAALDDQPDYIKALQRRATANEKLGTWTSLAAALEDNNRLAGLPDTPKSLLPGIRQAQRTLPRRIEERKEVETKEMMDKLKGLGNSLLGKFGLSTDNFQFTKSEDSGGYSMNFVQNASK